MGSLLSYLRGKSFAKQSKVDIGTSNIFKATAFNVLKLLHFRSKNEKQIYLHSTFRSGSTWLAEMLSAQPKARLINEPLSPYKYKVNDLISPTEPSQIYFHDKQENLNAILRYLEKLANGKTHLSHRYDLLSRNHSFFSRLAVFKLLRVSPLIKFLVDNFEGVHIILIRHPIAASLSKVKSGIRVPGRAELFLNNSAYASQYLNDELVVYANEILSCGTELEASVLEWCLDNKPFVEFACDQRDANLLVLSYEQLVNDPTNIVKKILIRAGTSHSSSRVLSSANKVSAAAGSYSSEDVKSKLARGKAKDVLYKFSETLSSNEIISCNKIIQKFGMGIYLEESYEPTIFFDLTE